MTIDDSVKRILHTFWQTLLGALGAVWLASGVDLQQITNVDAARKAGLAVLAALFAAALSAIKTAVVQTYAARQVKKATVLANGALDISTLPAASADHTVTDTDTGLRVDVPAIAPAAVAPPAPTA